ncbi:MAG: protein translocase subunit SecF, partial [Marinobacter alexandrii]
MSEHEKKPFDFMGFRKLASVLSIALLVASVVLLAVRGLDLGMDFTGGTSVEIEYAEAPALEDIRNTLDSAGYDQFVV